MEDTRIHKRSKVLHEVDKISNLKEMLENTRKNMEMKMHLLLKLKLLMFLNI